MQSGDFDLAAIIKEDNYARSSRMHRGMIGGGNDVFMTVTSSNCEGSKAAACDNSRIRGITAGIL